jgi:hypothetical protein
LLPQSCCRRRAAPSAPAKLPRPPLPPPPQPSCRCHSQPQPTPPAATVAALPPPPYYRHLRRRAANTTALPTPQTSCRRHCGGRLARSEIYLRIYLCRFNINFVSAVFRTKHKFVSTGHKYLRFCVFVFLGMLQYPWPGEAPLGVTKKILCTLFLQPTHQRVFHFGILISVLGRQ